MSLESRLASLVAAIGSDIKDLINGQGAKITISTVQPTLPNAGDMWFHSTTGELRICRIENSVATWYDVGGIKSGAEGRTVSETTYTYNSDGSVSQIDQDGEITSFTYDSEGRVATKSYPSKGVTRTDEYEYSADGSLHRIYDQSIN